MKAKRASEGGARRRLRRAAALSARPKRESEPFCGAAIAVRGAWSDWSLLAAPDAPDCEPGWRCFGAGFVRTHIPVPPAAAAGKARVLVELAVAPQDMPGAATPLFSRILCDSATNAAASVLRANAVLKWRLHRAITQGRSVLLRMAQIDNKGHSLRQQRQQLRKSNSYAWNSGRLLSGANARDLLSVPAPRARLLSKFVRSL